MANQNKKSNQTAKEVITQPKGRDLSGGTRGGERSKPEEAPEPKEPPIVESNVT